MMNCPKCGEDMSEGRQYKGKVTFKCDMQSITNYMEVMERKVSPHMRSLYYEYEDVGCGHKIILESKFKLGDEVMITKLTQFKSWQDEMFKPQTVREISFIQGIITYALQSEDNEIAWIYEEQLQSIAELLELGIIEEDEHND